MEYFIFKAHGKRPWILQKDFGCIDKSTAHGCWTLDFFVSDIKLQAIYKVIHTSNYDGHINKYVCKIVKYNQKCVSRPKPGLRSAYVVVFFFYVK
jgi:hypothetical protein